MSGFNLFAVLQGSVLGYRVSLILTLSPLTLFTSLIYNRFAKITLLSTLLAGAFAQDTPSPSAFQGKWSGSTLTAFGAANPADANSLECIPNNVQIKTSSSLNIGQFPVSFSGLSASSASSGPSSYSLGAVPAKNFTWAAGPSGGPNSNAGVVKLRVSPTTLQCYWAQVSGSGSSRKLTFVTLGGANQNFATQCDPASYTAIPDVTTKPFCSSPPNSRAPLVSTTLSTFDFKGDYSGSSGVVEVMISGSAALFAAVAAAGLL